MAKGKFDPQQKAADVYAAITEKIIISMESGNIPWRKPWSGDLPRNLFTKKNYRGVNNWLLSMIPCEAPYFATYKQVNAAGGQVKKGSKALPIYFFSMRTYTDKNGEEKKYPLMKQYSVFGLDQIENLDPKYLPAPKTRPEEWAANEEAQNLLTKFLINERSTGLVFEHNGNDRAFYAPYRDSIHLPSKGSFIDANAYYSTAFHEIGHATGAAKRLNRDGITKTGDKSGHYRGAVYSFEELIAELTASYICALTGIDNELEIGQRAAYIKSWLKVLKDDPKMIWQASSAAQKAADYILKSAGIDFGPEETEETEEVANG